MKKIVYTLSACLLIFWSCQIGLNPDSYLPHEWKTSSPEAQGLNSRILNQAFREARQRGFINCILVVRNGYLVAEQYFNGYDKKDAHRVMSVSKSFLSALIGIAFRENLLDSLEQKMLDFFPEYVTPNLDQRKRDISIRHLLTMKAGIDHEQNNYFEIYTSANWIETTIELPLLSDPGERFRYNTFQTHLLSGILTKASAMSTLAFANTNLMEPLGITVQAWERDPQGIYFGGNGMEFTARDMAWFGWLYLNNGCLDGEQIVPAEWVEASLTNHTGWQNLTWGELHDYNYGYLWWLGKIKEYEIFLALGHGGQTIINFPALNLVVVTTAQSYVDWDTADAQERSVLDVVANFILPSVVR